MKPFFLLLLFFGVLISFTNTLNILFILPCYGGHFATMSSLITSLSLTNDITVVATSPLCDEKVAALQKVAKFELIEKDIGWGDVQFDSFLDVVKNALETLIEKFTAQFDFLKDFLAQNKSKFHVMIVDLTMEGALLAGEVNDFPTVSLMNTVTGATEHVVDKMEIPISEIILVQIFWGYYWSHMRKTPLHGLPSLVEQGNFFFAEYPVRFPTMVAGSPLVYPEVHPSMPHTFIGGLRNESHYAQLDSDLRTWLDAGETDVVYISLGTIFKISESSLEHWVNQIRNQQQFRFIWYMNKDMHTIVNDLELVSDRKLFISGFLPQFTLLGHEKVKMFVTHGGLGSLTDVIKRRKPFVCSPQMFDQPYNCRRMKSLGASEISEFNFEQIMDAIRMIFNDYDSYVSKVNLIANDYQSYEKREQLESFLSRVAAEGKADVTRDFGFELCSPKCANVWMVTKAFFITILVLLIFVTYKLNSLVIKTCCGGSHFEKPKKS